MKTGKMDVLTYLSRIRANADLVREVVGAEPIAVSGGYAQLLAMRIEEDAGNLRQLLLRIAAEESKDRLGLGEQT